MRWSACCVCIYTVESNSNSNKSWFDRYNENFLHAPERRRLTCHLIFISFHLYLFLVHFAWCSFCGKFMLKILNSNENEPARKQCVCVCLYVWADERARVSKTSHTRTGKIKTTNSRQNYKYSWFWRISEIITYAHKILHCSGSFLSSPSFPHGRTHSPRFIVLFCTNILHRSRYITECDWIWIGEISLHSKFIHCCNVDGRGRDHIIHNTHRHRHIRIYASNAIQIIFIETSRQQSASIYLSNFSSIRTFGIYEKRKRMTESAKFSRASEEKGEKARTNEEIEMKQNRNLANTEKYTSKTWNRSKQPK